MVEECSKNVWMNLIGVVDASDAEVEEMLRPEYGCEESEGSFEIKEMTSRPKLYTVQQMVGIL